MLLLNNSQDDVHVFGFGVENGDCELYCVKW